MSICHNCNRKTHTSSGKCTACGERKLDDWERKHDRREENQSTDVNYQGLSGFFIIIILLILLAGAVAISGL